MKSYSLFYLSAAYGEGNYNTGVYNQTGTNTGTQTPTDTNGGQLANTGFEVLLVATIACVVIFAALAIRMWKKGKK